MMEALVPFAATAIVGLWGVLCLLAAGSGHGARLGLPVPLAGLGLALAAALAGLTAPALAGALAADGALVVDRLAALFDLVIVGALIVAVATDPHPDGDPRALWSRGMALLAGAGAMLAARAGDLPTLIAGLELATLSGGLCLLASRDGASEAAERAGRKAARAWLFGQGVAAAVLWLGVGLVVAATGTVSLHELGGRVGAVFLRWGASTTLAAVDVLQGPEELPAGLVAHARDAAVEGMAPAALFVPGALLLFAGLLARAGVFPLLAGRVGVAGRAGLVGLLAIELVVRTGAIAALIRVLVAALHLPRVVFAPYGWGTAAAVIGGLSAVVCAIAAARAADLRRLIAWAAAAQAGLSLLAIAAAANFVAHAGLRTGGLQLDDHYLWGHLAGEAAVAAVVAGWIAFVIAAAGTLAAAAAVHAGRGPADLAGLARRSPLLTAALVVSLLGLAAAPPTAGFAARALLVSAVFEDSNLLVQAMLGAGALAGALLGWAALRVLLAALEPAPGDGPRPRRAATAVAVLLAGLSLGAGLYGHAFTSMSEDAAAGVAFMPGGKGRREWLDRRDGR